MNLLTRRTPACPDFNCISPFLYFNPSHSTSKYRFCLLSAVEYSSEINNFCFCLKYHSHSMMLKVLIIQGTFMPTHKRYETFSLFSFEDIDIYKRANLIPQYTQAGANRLIILTSLSCSVRYFLPQPGTGSALSSTVLRSMTGSEIDLVSVL